tara:strand:+ start:373 stop:924 length:552 start_codon:yes stop_codon:yes gene_type:complete
MSKLKILFWILIFMFSFLNKGISDNSKTLFDFKINTINGDELNLSTYKGKTVLIVNVASNCGFTKQYDDLQNLYDIYSKKGLVILGIPSNQFGNQEPGSEDEIKDFCKTNFNITFPMTSKYDVKGENAHPIFLWAKKSFGNSTVPKWNFHKILVNKHGKIVDTFASFTNPKSNKIIKKIDDIL